MKKSATTVLMIAALTTSSVFAQSFSQPRSNLEQRVQRLERLLESRALVNMSQRLDALERDIQRLQGNDEVHEHRLKTLARRQQELSKELQATDRTGDDDLATGDTPPPDPVALPSSTEAVDADPAREQEVYRQGSQLLRKGDYAGAITALKGYLKNYPDGQYAANAQYWIGEAHYVEREFKQALEDFARVLANHPDSSKVPDAMLKMGIIHAELQQPEQARKLLDEVRQRFPGSTAAKLAGDRLKGL